MHWYSQEQFHWSDDSFDTHSCEVVVVVQMKCKIAGSKQCLHRDRRNKLHCKNLVQMERKRN